MICRRCALRLQAIRPSVATASAAPALTRRLRSLNLNTLANPRPSPGRDHEGPPAATSTGAAQPFTTPLTPAPAGNQQPGKLAEPRGSLPAGTPMEGLGYLKNKPAPVALEDHEYPAWLWTLLDESKTGATGATAAEGDAYAKSKKQRRIAARAAAKAAKNKPEELFPPVPLEHQTIDLPAGDGTVDGARAAEAARAELTYAMRQSRRKSIKEGNYLGGMS